jgi:hypothetical protein
MGRALPAGPAAAQARTLKVASTVFSDCPVSLGTGGVKALGDKALIPATVIETALSATATGVRGTTLKVTIEDFVPDIGPVLGRSNELEFHVL